MVNADEFFRLPCLLLVCIVFLLSRASRVQGCQNNLPSLPPSPKLCRICGCLISLRQIHSHPSEYFSAGRSIALWFGCMAERQVSLLSTIWVSLIRPRLPLHFPFHSNSGFQKEGRNIDLVVIRVPSLTVTRRDATELLQQESLDFPTAVVMFDKFLEKELILGNDLKLYLQARRWQLQAKCCACSHEMSF